MSINVALYSVFSYKITCLYLLILYILLYFFVQNEHVDQLFPIPGLGNTVTAWETGSKPFLIVQWTEYFFSPGG